MVGGRGQETEWGEGCIVREGSEEGRVWEKGNLKRGSRGRGDEGVFNGPGPKL